jgi:hypothetical protein
LGFSSWLTSSERHDGGGVMEHGTAGCWSKKKGKK